MTSITIHGLNDPLDRFIREIAEIFGTVKNSLKLAGPHIPINDVWIASHALETGSVNVTYDKHFDVVPGVRVWK